MRDAAVTARVVLAALLATSALGCFVGEIDKSMANYNGGKATAPAEKPAAPAAGAAPKQAASDKPAAAGGPSWWQTASTLGSEESQSDIVGCRLAGGVEFMLRDDCLARGGAIE